MSHARGGPLVVARSLVEGLTRSLVLVALTGFAPAVCVAAGAGLSAVVDTAAGAAGCLLGVLVAVLVLVARPVSAATRFLVARWTGGELPAAYQPLVPVTRMATGYWWNGYDYQRLRWFSLCQRWILRRTRDPAAWRDVLWLLVAPVTVGVASAIPPALIAVGVAGLAPHPVTSVVAVGVGTALLPRSWRSLGPVARRVLGPSTVELLSTRVASLVRGRADLTRAQDAELHRIERDLHDGAQARLVAIGLSLSAAERLVDTDPAGTRALLRQARATSLAALRDLRELVHGIVPPVLLERGLVDAVRALAVDAPVRTVVRSTLGRRLDTPVESALYFATAELVANAVKHSGATVVDIGIDRTGTGVAVTVTDDGRGGADRSRGSGLTGVESRLAAFDGTLRVDSPPGGPTTATAEVPCASS
ncbi:sensor histidine kinase [Umezawaea sp.]|uniref:sensor histidine kinase n=1 Tax=Umezawaea sp. TaxID=1955258 RepID=UPI002ED57899